MRVNPNFFRLQEHELRGFVCSEVGKVFRCDTSRIHCREQDSTSASTQVAPYVVEAQSRQLSIDGLLSWWSNARQRRTLINLKGFVRHWPIDEGRIVLVMSASPNAICTIVMTQDSEPLRRLSLLNHHIVRILNIWQQRRSLLFFPLLELLLTSAVSLNKKVG